MLLVVLKGHVRHHRRGHADAENVPGFFQGACTDVDGHVGYLRNPVLLGVGHEVRRLRGDHAGDVVAVPGLHTHPMGGDVAVDPAAHGDEFQRAVGPYGVHHEAHLVGVGVQLHHGPVAGMALAIHIQIAQAVLPYIQIVRRIASGHLQYLVLKAGHAVGVGERRDHTEPVHHLSLPHFLSGSGARRKASMKSAMYFAQASSMSVPHSTVAFFG